MRSLAEIVVINNPKEYPEQYKYFRPGLNMGMFFSKSTKPKPKNMPVLNGEFKRQKITQK